MIKIKYMHTFVILFCLAAAATGQVYHIGIGFTLQQPLKMDFQSSSTIELYKFYIPVTVDSNARLMPELAYWQAEYDVSGLASDINTYKYSALQAGLGFYYMLYVEKTGIYFGPRYAIAMVKVPESLSNTKTEKTDRILGLTFGAEYPLLKYLNIGFEVQYNYYEIEPWNDGDSQTRNLKAIETVFVITFHI